MVNPRVHAKAQEVGEAQPLRLAMLRQVGPAMATVAACVVATYVVPSLEFARPWKTGDPLPFWNLIGRPLDAEELQAEEDRAEEVEEVAQEVLAAKDPEPVVAPPREVVEVDAVETLPPYEAR